MKKRKEKRIKEEKERLLKLYEDLPREALALFAGLLDQASFMRIELEDMAEDLAENGRVEMFSQSKDQKPYERERPVVRQYTQMVGKYQSILKTLEGKLPSGTEIKFDDGFEDFINIR